MQEAIEALLGSLEMKPPPPEPRRKEDVEAEYMQRVVRQLERQAALNTSLLEDQARKATSLTVLSATAEALSRRSDLKTALRDALYYCLDAAGLSTGAVYLSSPEGGLRLEAQVGLIAEGRTRELPSLSDLELLPQVLASGRPVTVSSEAAAAEVASDLLQRLDATSALLVPFGAATNARGLLLMASRSRDQAASDCLPFAQTLAAQFGQALALKQAFDQVASSGKRYRALVEHANDGISVLSTDGLILEVNRRMEDILGVPRERAVGRHISEFVPGDQAFESVRRFHETAVGGGGRLEKVALQRADGTLVEVDFSISTTEIDGQPCVLSIGRDVTERRRAEEVLVERVRLSSFAADVNMALTRSEGLGDMLDGCTEAMVRHLDAALARIWTLAAGADVLELRASSGLGADIGGAHARIPMGSLTIGLIAEERRPQVTNDLQNDARVSDREWARREGMVSFAGYPLMVDGQLVGVAALFARRVLSEFTLKALATAADSIALGIGRKHTERDLRLKEEQLRQAQGMEAIGQLAGGVAHDFNNLLGVITGYGDLLQRDIGPRHPAFRRVEEIRKAAERASGLTRQLLAFSRKQVLKPQALDLNAVVRDIEEMLRRLIGEQVQLITNFAGDLGRVRADRGQMEQLVVNLALNARDAMPVGGKLIVVTANVELDEPYVRSHPEAPTGPHVMLSVSDSGHGMNAETLSHMFEPFFTTKKEGHGTGLGLATVYGIVRQNDGHVTVSSNPGRGTTFKIYLPRIGDRVAPMTTEARPIVYETILLVEDEQAVRVLMGEILEAAGYQVLEAATPEEALAHAGGHPGPIQLVVTDVILPRMSGREVAEALRRARPDTRVLYVSGCTDDVLSGHGILEAGVHFLPKPFTSDDLLHKIRNVLDAR